MFCVYIPARQSGAFTPFPRFSMRTLATAIAAAIASMALALPVAAQTATTSAGAASSADLACMSAAVGTRENALISARTTFNASVMAALQTRRDALLAAYTIADHQNRRAAIEAAIRAYAKATADARAKFSADIKVAWSVFMTARVNCHIDQAASANVRVRTMESERIDHGLHLGWMKTGVHSKSWMNGHVKLDLSF